MAGDEPTRETTGMSEADATRKERQRREDEWDLLNHFAPFITVPAVIVRTMREFLASLREGKQRRDQSK
jgi:hypothetical protein